MKKKIKDKYTEYYADMILSLTRLRKTITTLVKISFCEQMSSVIFFCKDSG